MLNLSSDFAGGMRKVWQSMMSRVRFAYILVLSIGIVTAIILIKTAAFDRLAEIARSNQEWDIAELFVALVVSVVVCLALLVVRAKDLRSEMKRRAGAEKRLSQGFNIMHQGISMFDADGRLVICNQRYAELYNLHESLLRPGTSFQEIAEYRRSIDQNALPEDYVNQLLADLKKQETLLRIRELGDGRSVCIIYGTTPDGGWISTHEDVTERLELETRLNQLAHRDGLTGLANRVAFNERIGEAMATALRGGNFAVLYLDLDHFKQINDTLGHPVGDALLQHVGDLLRSGTRESDVVARMGGDEFAILQIVPDQPAAATALASRLIEEMSQPVELLGHRLQIGTSIGIALAPDDGDNADQLLKNADLALYLAKSEGRGTYRFFEPELDKRMHERRQLELDLRQALLTGGFELHYQPIYSLQANEITGYEALIRWNHPTRGRVPPDGFIQLAEEAGLIGQIGDWVLRQACSDAATWPGDLMVSVNVSAVQFKRQNLVEGVVNALAVTGLLPTRLELEITETALLHNSEQTIDALHQLRAIGVRIAMDDFGVGYSSLSYFQSFPFDKIKLDRSFIKGLNENPTSLAILRAVASLGSNLSITTTAEGVETQDQLDRIRAEGISQAQGYLIGKPMPIGDISGGYPSAEKIFRRA